MDLKAELMECVGFGIMWIAAVIVLTTVSYMNW